MIVASNTLPLHRGQGLCPLWGYLPLGQRVEKGPPLRRQVLVVRRHRRRDRRAAVASDPEPGGPFPVGRRHLCYGFCCTRGKVDTESPLMIAADTGG